jgi:hypothetical protein
MKKLEKLKEEKAIEEYPGYLGHIWAGDYLDLIKELSFLSDIPWKRYQELTGYLDDPTRHINVKFESIANKKLIGFDPWNDPLASILDQVPSVEVRYDDFSDDQNTSGGYAHIFFLKDGYQLQEAINDIKEVSKALNADYSNLEDEAQKS